jgi:hypothetical protein
MHIVKTLDSEPCEFFNAPRGVPFRKISQEIQFGSSKAARSVQQLERIEANMKSGKGKKKKK